MLESKALLSSNFFHTNLLSFFKIQAALKFHSVMPGASNLAISMCLTCFPTSGIFKVAAHNKYYFKKSRSHDDLAAKGLSRVQGLVVQSPVKLTQG